MIRAGSEMGRAGGSVDASALAKFIVQAADLTLPNAQDLSALATGLLLNTAGVLTKAVAGTDYIAPSSDRQSKIAAFADTLITWTDPFELFDDDLTTRWTEANTASGTRKRAGISAIELAATASAGDVAALLFGTNMGAAGFPFFIKGGAAAKFYAEFRMRLTTAIDAQAFALLGDDTQNAWGLRGASSTGFFVARFDNGPTTLTSTIAVDNGTWHRFRVYRDGTTGFLQVDSETPVSSANAYVSTDTRLMLRLGNGTTAAARKAEFDYVFVRGERP